MITGVASPSWAAGTVIRSYTCTMSAACITHSWNTVYHNISKSLLKKLYTWNKSSKINHDLRMRKNRFRDSTEIPKIFFELQKPFSIFLGRSPGHITALSIIIIIIKTFSWTNKVCVVPFIFICGQYNYSVSTTVSWNIPNPLN